MGRFPRLCVLFIVVSSAAAVAKCDDALPPNVIQQLKDATVYVKTAIGPLQMTGSGFVIEVTGDSALIATNQHVVSKPAELKVGGHIPGLHGRDRLALAKLQRGLAAAKPAVAVVFNSGNGNEQLIQAEILGGLDDPDLAILKVSGIKSAPKPIVFRNVTEPVETMALYILGFPFGDALATGKGNPSITIGKGSVSSIRKNESGKTAKIQIDGALNPGNSGGPVVDLKGNLVGIAVQTIQGSNIGLAIPPAELTGMLEGRVGKATIVATNDQGGARKYEIVIPVIDPMKKLKSVSVQYLDGAVAIDSSKSGQSQLASAAGSKAVTLTITGPTARATLPLAASTDQKPREVTVQASFVNEQGKPVHLDPLVLKVAAAPAVVTTVQKDGNSTTVTQTQKNGKRMSRRTVTITRGSGGPSKVAKKDADDDDDDMPAGDDSTEKDEKPVKQEKGKNAPQKSEKTSAAETGLAWTNKISKMKKIPDEEVTGKIDGIEFTLDRASITGGRLVFHKHPKFRGVFSELEVDLALFLKPNQDISGQKVIVNGRIRSGDPHVTVKSMRKGDRIPNTGSHLDYLLVLEFGDYEAATRTQPGKIYLCVPDRAKSFLAGSFEASID